MDGRSVRDYADFSRLMALKHALGFGTVALVFVVVLTGFSNTPLGFSVPLSLRAAATVALALAVVAAYRLVTAYWFMRLDRRIRERYDPVGEVLERRSRSDAARAVLSSLPSVPSLPRPSGLGSERFWEAMAWTTAFVFTPLTELLVVVRWAPPPPIELPERTILIVQFAMSVVMFAIGWATATAFLHLAKRTDAPLG